MTDTDRLFLEADRRERDKIREDLAAIDRICAIIDRNLDREPEPESGSITLIIAAAFALVMLAAVFFAPSETAQLLGY